MIIRKPYAFLIKNFKKIHIMLLVLSIYVGYKLISISSFVNEFMTFGIYDSLNNPINNYVTSLLKISLLLLVIGSLSILVLLSHKKKPWKLYLVPVIEYIVLYMVLNMISNFFRIYSSDVSPTDIRFSRDLLVLFSFVQIFTILIFVIRVFGLDFKKFNFNLDQEYLELSDKDREEVEIGLELDKYALNRLIKKLRRNIDYFYLEHKFICNTVLGVFSIIFVLIGAYSLLITNKVYTEGNIYNVNGYAFVVNESYITDKNYTGKVISSKSNFIILNITVTNNLAPRKLKLENFHIKNRTLDYVTTDKIYAKEFQDLGNTYDRVKELKRGETIDLIIVYKVDKKLDKDGFVLFYQEGNGYLRTIKLKLKDVSKIKKEKELLLKEDLKFKYKKEDVNISLDKYELLKNGSYTIRNCTRLGCDYSQEEFSFGDEYRVLKMEFGSDVFEGKDMVDFCREYGKIIYIDGSGGVKELSFNYPFKNKATGKNIYSLVPVEVEHASNILITYTIRDKEYTYKLK